MYDIIIIGAGVIGCSIARELSRYKAKIAVLERNEDVCSGTSKANSAIIHAGFDAENGTLKAKYNVLGNRMMDRISKELDIPFKRNGAYVLCDDVNKMDKLQELLERGIKNGVQKLEIISGDELRKREKNVSDNIVAALYAPDSGIVCPFNMTIAYAENAAVNGVDFFTETLVEKITRISNGYNIETNNGTFDTVAIVNAAGVYADVFHNMVSNKKIKITSKRGDYFLLDKNAGNHVNSTMFQLPGDYGKGVLVTPTIHGNLLVGPTSFITDDKEAVNTTEAGYEYLKDRASAAVKDLPYRQIITSFAGLRAHEGGNDFIIGEVKDAENFFDAAGIESPGLSSAPAIAADLSRKIGKKLTLSKNEAFIRKRKGILNPAHLSAKARAKLIKEQPEYGEIICRCETISEGEIIDAIKRPVGAKSLDGIKRRTRAGMGRCQSGFCSPRAMEILARELNIEFEDITKCGGESKIIQQRRFGGSHD